MKLSDEITQALVEAGIDNIDLKPSASHRLTLEFVTTSIPGDRYYLKCQLETNPIKVEVEE